MTAVISPRLPFACDCAALSPDSSTGSTGLLESEGRPWDYADTVLRELGPNDSPGNRRGLGCFHARHPELLVLLLADR